MIPGLVLLDERCAPVLRCWPFEAQLETKKISLNLIAPFRPTLGRSAAVVECQNVVRAWLLSLNLYCYSDSIRVLVTCCAASHKRRSHNHNVLPPNVTYAPDRTFFSRHVRRLQCLDKDLPLQGMHDLLRPMKTIEASPMTLAMRRTARRHCLLGMDPRSRLRERACIQEAAQNGH